MAYSIAITRPAQLQTGAEPLVQFTAARANRIDTLNAPIEMEDQHLMAMLKVVFALVASHAVFFFD